MDKVYITPQASLMSARHYGLEKNHFFLCVSSIQLYLGECWLLPSRGFKAKLMVTTSDHVLVNMADFGGDLVIEGDVLAAKRSDEDDDTTGGESDGTFGTSASTESDAESTPEKRRRPGANHKPRPPKSNNPLACNQLSLVLQSEVRKLQHVDLRGAGVSKAEWDKVCEAANEAISLLQPGSRTTDVAAMFTSFATGERGQHGVEIYAMDLVDDCTNRENESSVSDHESTGQDPRESTNDLDHMETATCREDTLNLAVAL